MKKAKPREANINREGTDGLWRVALIKACQGLKESLLHLSGVSIAKMITELEKSK